MDIPTITKVELLNTIRQGVSEAVRAALPTIEQQDIARMISEGFNEETVCKAIREAFSREDIEGAISRGVCDAMPYGSLILGAITDGMNEAMRKGK